MKGRERITDTHLITLQSLQVRWSWVKSRHSTLSISCRGTWRSRDEKTVSQKVRLWTWHTNALWLVLLRDFKAPYLSEWHFCSNAWSLSIVQKPARSPTHDRLSAETTDVKRTKGCKRETYVYSVVFELYVKAVARQSDDNFLSLLRVVHALAVQHRERDLHNHIPSLKQNVQKDEPKYILSPSNLIETPARSCSCLISQSGGSSTMHKIQQIHVKSYRSGS